MPGSCRVARSIPIRVRILNACRLMPAWNCWIAVVGEPDRTAGKEHRRQRDVEREGRMVASAEPAADIARNAC